MKNSFNFDLEINHSRSLMRRRRKKSSLLLLLIILLGLAIYLALPQVIKSAPLAEPESPVREQIIKKLSLPNLATIRATQNHAELKQEVQNLLNQKYIDPLTKYIEKYRFDDFKSRYVSTLKTEREQRCVAIEKRYQKMKKDSTTLAQLKSGYNYSCPQVVANFAESLTQARERKSQNR